MPPIDAEYVQQRPKSILNNTASAHTELDSSSLAVMCALFDLGRALLVRMLTEIPIHRRKGRTFTNSHRLATASSTTPCPSVPAVRVPKPTSKRISTNSQIVRIAVMLCDCSLLILRSAGDLPTLIKHGLHALRDTLQQDKELTPLNTSLGIVGISSTSDAPASTDPKAPAALGESAQGGFQKFRIIEGDDLQPYLDSMDPKETPGSEEVGAADASAPAPSAAAPATDGVSTDPSAAASGDNTMETD